MSRRIIECKKKSLVAIVLCLTFFVGCKNASEEKKPTPETKAKAEQVPKKNQITREQLIGAWLRNQDGVQDVLELRSDGTFALAGNPYWVGRNWKFENDSLQLEVMGLTPIDDDFSYVSYAVVPQSDPKIFNLRTNAEKNIANNDAPFVKLATHYPTDHWIGRWKGAEGAMLEILPHGDFYDIVLYELDGVTRIMSEKITHRPEIVFYTDDSKKHIIKAGTGEETGMKGLMHKTDCLLIPSMGTGYCK